MTLRCLLQTQSRKWKRCRTGINWPNRAASAVVVTKKSFLQLLGSSKFYNNFCNLCYTIIFLGKITQVQLAPLAAISGRHQTIAVNGTLLLTLKILSEPGEKEEKRQSLAQVSAALLDFSGIVNCFPKQKLLKIFRAA